MKLYSYYRSSAAYRVRIALNLKGLDYDYEAVNLLEAQQKSQGYRATNPQALVPALTTDDGAVLGQSIAILEWLEEMYPQPALLPGSPMERAAIRGVVNHIACDIHPLNNISILFYLRDELTATPEQTSRWYSQWVRRGFDGLEQQLAETSGLYCFGDAPTMADVCLVPQFYNARRFEVNIEDYPTINRIVDYCNNQDAFDRARPEKQPDTPEGE